MRKYGNLFLFLCTGLISVFIFSCKNDSYLLTPPPTPDQSFIEEFDTVSAAISRGWKLSNASAPLGSNIWQQGGSVSPWFSPYSSNGTYAGFIGADYSSTSADQGIISNWLISPPVILQNGDKIIFYTRAYLYALSATDSTDFANNLELRVNTSNDGTDVGNGLYPGSFNKLLVEVNRDLVEYHSSPALYDPLAYPARWTRFEGTISGLQKPVKGRFAFRYFIEGGGFNGLGSGVAIDQVQYKSAGK